MKKVLLFSFFVIANTHLYAQYCTNQFFTATYKGQEANSIVRSIVTPQNELVSVGTIDYSKSGFFQMDGWVTKLTPNGSVIWSKSYKTQGYNILQFRDIVSCSDSGFLIVGYEQNIDSIDFNIQGWGVILKLDLYGNVVWAKSLNDHFNSTTEYNLMENITSISGNNFIINSVCYDRKLKSSRSIILRINAIGEIKWANSISSPLFEFKYNINKSIIETTGNRLIFAGIIDQRVTANDSIVRSGFYFFSLDASTGSKLWDRTYIIRNKPSNVYFSTSSVQNISQLNNGDISFIAYLDTFLISIPPLTTRTANIITGPTGELKNVVTYKTTEKGVYTIDAKNRDNNITVLMYDGLRSILMETTKTGQIIGQKGYADLNSGSEPASLNVTNFGNYFYINDKTNLSDISLVKTDLNGDIACSDTPVGIIEDDGSKFISNDDAQMQFDQLIETSVFSDISISSRNYYLSSNFDCMQSCCSDFIDYSGTKSIQLCEGESFTLPDLHLVKDSGTYYVSYKRVNGCDSIVFYNIQITKNPKTLTLNAQNCLNKQDSVQIQATGGFDSYNWMNKISTDSILVVKNPGTYWVSVENSCGFKKEDITISRECDISIPMPNVFTPNGDGINDFFRIPPSIKNKLIRLTIYNRWGEKIFETSDALKGWNGMFKGKPVASGTFIYFFTMESFEKKLFSQKGVFTLIR